MNPIIWFMLLFVHGLICYLVGGWEERRTHDKWHLHEEVDYDYQTFLEANVATKWTTEAKLTAQQFDILKSTGLLRNDEEVAAFDDWERSL